MIQIHFIINPIAGSGNHNISKKVLQPFFDKNEYEIIVNNFRKKLHELPEEEWKKYSREVGKPVFNDFLDIVIFDKRDFDFNHRDGLKKWLKFNENKMPIDYLKLRITIEDERSWIPLRSLAAFCASYL